MAVAPGSLESLRRVNRARVLAVLQRRGRASRADIVRASGLSRTTVSSLVADLLEEGVVVERPDPVLQAPTSSGGRPPILLALDPASGTFVGIDFGHDSVNVALADRSGDLLANAREELDVDYQADLALATATRIVRGLLDNAGISPKRVLGVGAAVSAPLRSRDHAFASQRIFPGWAALDVSRALGSRLGLPVYVGNDANLGALAEATFGAGRDVQNLIYVMLSSGVGAGIILDGALYEGDTGTAGELGHVVVDPSGPICRCGNRGCLETLAGVSALTRALQHRDETTPTLAGLLALCEAGDPGVRRLIADAGRAVGQALAAMCSVLDPALVIVGGELATADGVLLDAIREMIDQRTAPAPGHPYKVVRGALADKAEVLGAVALAMITAASGQPDVATAGGQLDATTA
ncbi:MAG TPA: ROK family transcriptional regulator [Solirubrobacteraceae bacterium]|nr:ROK family transcriptional regulator [Solirubrobacteraceae bacterium]